ncbi:hypothetical protein BGX24_007063, partial [Mortierella sp. AD032]
DSMAPSPMSIPCTPNPVPLSLKLSIMSARWLEKLTPRLCLILLLKKLLTVSLMPLARN